jgi:preprotein translocase subunit SecG
MSIFIIIMHVVVCIALIMIVLLQTGKGADMGAAFGGGTSQTLFGASGGATFLSKATTVVAIVFMLTSLFLAYASTQRREHSIMLDAKAPIEEKAPDEKAPPPKAEPSQAEKTAQPKTSTQN